MTGELGIDKAIAQATGKLSQLALPTGGANNPSSDATAVSAIGAAVGNVVASAVGAALGNATSDPATQKALGAMDSVFYGSVDQSGSGGKFTKIEKDANDSNDTSESADAASQVQANQGLETAGVAKLGPDQQTAYKQVIDSTQNDPIAHLSMQKLLLEGKFTSAPKNKDNQDLLGALQQVAKQPTADGIDKGQLMSQLVHEVAVPDSINQHVDGTCTVTSTGIKEAIDNPAEYARLIGGLASPSGQVQLANGDTIQRSQDWSNSDDGGRSLPQQLWEPALMNYGVKADGSGVSYNNAQDKASDAKAHDGLSDKEVNRVVAGVTGQKVTDEHEGDGAFLGFIGGRSKDDMINDITKHANGGNAVPVGVKWGDKKDEGHEILVTGVRNGQVYFDNPWGAQQSMTVDEFKGRLNDAHIVGS